MTLRDILKYYNKEVPYYKRPGSAKIWDRLLSTDGECVLYDYGISGGYPRIVYLGHIIGVAKLLLMTITDSGNNKLELRHLCHNKKCVNPNHLAFGTRADNVMDSLKDNRFRSGNEKLTADNINEIRSLYGTGEYSHRSLGKIFGVSHASIGSVIKYQSYKWIKDAKN